MMMMRRDASTSNNPKRYYGQTSTDDGTNSINRKLFLNLQTSATDPQIPRALLFSSLSNEIEQEYTAKELPPAMVTTYNTQLTKNKMAVALIDSWLSNANEEECKRDSIMLNKLISELEKNRTSKRKLFPWIK